MTSTTARLELVLPDYDAQADVEVLNDNFTKIDAAVDAYVVTNVADITDPFNGQFAFQTSNNQLRFYIDGLWILIAAGDVNTDNPNRIKLPSAGLNAIDDQTNAFQIGPDAGSNLSVDQAAIQSRNNEIAAILYLNRYGGAVKIGTDGIYADGMIGDDAVDNSTLSGIASTAWANGGASSLSCQCKVPPSGRVLVLLEARSQINSSSGYIEIGVEVTKVGGGGGVLVAPGTNGAYIRSRAAAANDANNMSTSAWDYVKGLNPGDTIKAEVQWQKDVGGTNVDILHRKIGLIPQL